MWAVGCGGDSWASFQYVNGKAQGLNETTVHKKPFLGNGRRHRLVISVRKNLLGAYLDGQMLVEYKTADFSEMSLPASSGVYRDERLLGAFTWESQFVFNSIELLEVTGQGKRTR
jgi:hypothetical protein